MTITGAPSRFPLGQWILPPANSGRRNTDLFYDDDDVTVSSSDSVFGFLEGSEVSSVSDCVNEDINQFGGEEEEENSSIHLQASKNFWENQHNLLQATLRKTTKLETRIRGAMKKALKEIKEEENIYCKCGKEKAAARNECQLCLMREVSSRLQNAGYNCVVCRSNWKSSPEIPAGQHTYIDVIDNSSPNKGEVRVIMELYFRAEFEIGRASEDYNQLTRRLPEVFVGKVERLRAVVKIMCSAARKCMKDRKMHMGPWRKHKYMQAKWFSPCERLETQAQLDFVLSKKPTLNS